MSAPLFKWLVRFMDSENKIHFGEVQEDQPASSDLVGLRVKVYEGNGPWDSRFILSSTERVISKLHLPALESDPNSGCVKDSKAANKYADTECLIEHVPIFLGVGLNYRKHAEEANVRLRPGLFWSMELEPLLISLQFPIPPYPMIFTKPSAALAGPREDIHIHKEAKRLDYEGELCVVIGKDCKNLSELEHPMDYVLGNTVGNDVSSRWWQQPAQSGNQHGYAKSFDQFAPIGPILCSPTWIPDLSKLILNTRVNGAERQLTGTDDLIFDVPSIIKHLSRGMTLQKGSVIMTGTPGGVGAFMKPPEWLADGDIVAVEISQIGTIQNL